MNLYPALKASMGRWTYYIVKMQMKDLVKEVGFASEIYENKTLDDAIQRVLDEGRVKKEIVQYLGKRDDRFFSSIVVAALGGNPTYTPVEIADDPRFALLRTAGFDETFGILTFDGGQKYFALDGQHRLKAIQTLIEQKEPDIPEVPEGFRDEEISVIMIIRREADAEFMASYRRIFSSLNRYAQKTDADTNIIMDEDDVTAILTRRLLTEHDFFKWSGKPNTSPHLKTKGKNLHSGETYFTTLQTLYSMNQKLLSTAERGHRGFTSKLYKQFRPPEDDLDDMFCELVIYWDAMLEEIPVLKTDPSKMREHNALPDNPDGLMDNLLFWPIGQELFADVARILLNRHLPNPDSPSSDEVRSCIRVFSSVNWDLRLPPWAGLLLIQDPDGVRKRMRSEDRKRAINVAKSILLLQIGLDDSQPEDLEELKEEWHALLMPRPSQDEIDSTWREVCRSVV